MRERLRAARSQQGPGDTAFGMRKGKIICSGLRPDGWAEVHRRYDQLAPPAVVPAGELNTAREADPDAWHEFLPHPEVGMRRHRRIDGVTLGAEVRLTSNPQRRLPRTTKRSSSAPVWVAQKKHSWERTARNEATWVITKPSHEAPSLG